MNKTNFSYNLNSLSKDEIVTILETLLFGSSVDVCANWYKENSSKMLDLAGKIKKYYPEICLENIFVYQNEKNEIFNDEHTDEILKIFPEIKKEKIENI
jgi:hypothetical protein